MKRCREKERQGSGSGQTIDLMSEIAGFVVQSAKQQSSVISDCVEFKAMSFLDMDTKRFLIEERNSARRTAHGVKEGVEDDDEVLNNNCL